MHVCPTKFLLARKLVKDSPRILDIGCGNHSPTTTKRWFKGCHYAGADIQQFNNTEEDTSNIDEFFLLGMDGSGYEQIPDGSFDFVIMNHVLEHISNPEDVLPQICKKLAPGGVIWIAFPSVKSLSFPSAEGTLNFCDDYTHVFVPEVREVANILLANKVKVIHAGRSKDKLRFTIGLVMYPYSRVKKLLTGRMSAKGLWYIMGFEDHVLGQRKPLLQ